MELHSFGEDRLDGNPPPKTATGLIIRERVYKDRQRDAGWLGKRLNSTYTPRFFIFREVIGSYDYHAVNDGEARCGAYEATMGYWHYATEEERDIMYEQLLEKGYTEY